MTRLRQFPSAFMFGAVVVALSAAIAGCTGSTASPSNTALYTQTDLHVGTGAVAANGNTLTVNYTGWLYDGSKIDLKGLQFETSVGQTPFTFILGSGQVIGGWDKGVPGMQVGGLRRLVIPPSLAYGTARSGKIPANATLVFEIELLTAQ